jgi:hypothetical protein
MTTGDESTEGLGDLFQSSILRPLPPPPSNLTLLSLQPILPHRLDAKPKTRHYTRLSFSNERPKTPYDFMYIILLFFVMHTAFVNTPIAPKSFVLFMPVQP